MRICTWECTDGVWRETAIAGARFNTEHVGGTTMGRMLYFKKYSMLSTIIPEECQHIGKMFVS